MKPFKTFQKIVFFFSLRHTRLQKLHDSQEPPMAKRRGSLKTSYSQLPEQDMLVYTPVTNGSALPDAALGIA